MTSTTLNGNPYSTDGSAARDMQGSDGYGFQAWLIPMFNDALADFSGKLTTASSYAAAAGSALPVIKYGWDTGTADVNPGSGLLRANGPPTSATTLYLSTSDTNAASIAAIIDLYDDSTSAVKGLLAIGHRTDPTKWAMYTVSGSVITATGYRKVTVAYVAGPGGFASGDPVAVGFVRTGDVGQTGATGAAGVDGANKISEGGTAGGTANALTCTASPTPTLARGVAVSFQTSASANTGAATLNANSTGAVTIQKNGSPLVAGDLPASTRVMVVYDGTFWQLQATGRAAATAADVAAGTSALVDVTPAALSGMTPLLGSPSGGLVYNDLVIVHDVSVGALRAVPVSAIATATQPSTSTWDPVAKASNITLTNSNLVATESTTNGIGCVLSTVGKSSGKWYCEIIMLSGIDFFVGVATASHPLTTRLGQTATSWAIYSNGKIQNNQAGDPTVAYGLSFTTGDRIGIAFDMATGKLWFKKNVVWMGSGDPVAGTNPAFSNLTGTIYIAVTGTGTGNPSYQYVPSLANWADMAPTGFMQF